MKLYSLPPSPNAIKVVALIHHLGLDVEIVPVDVRSGANREPDFLAKNPNGLLPVLEDGDFSMWESNAILAYLAQKKPESGLWPSDPQQQARVQQWMFWQTAHWADAIRPFVFERLIKPMFLQQQPDEERVQAALPAFERLAGLLEQHLSGRQYLLGDQLTVADFAVCSVLVYRQPAGIPLEAFPKLKAYFERVLETEAWRKALPPQPVSR